MGSSETQTRCSRDMQRSDLHVRTRLLIRRFGVRIPGGPPRKPADITASEPRREADLPNRHQSPDLGAGLARTIASSVAASPRQCSNNTLRSVRLSKWRSTSAATIASSRGPAIGMNSGMRSIGDAIQTTANTSQSLAQRGTPGSRCRPRKSTTKLGISVASSRACDRRPMRSTQGPRPTTPQPRCQSR
jgi:hypothetical protein